MIRLLGGVVLALALVAGAGAVAAYAEDEVGVSRDGRTWSDDLGGALFDASVRWVPGDVRTSRFFVRNRAAGGATLSIAVEARGPDHLLGSDDIALSARAGRGEWVDLERTANDHRFGDRVLGVGERTRVQVRAAFHPGSTNQSQRAELELRFRVVLTDADVAPEAESEVEPTTGAVDGFLPGTGARELGWLVLLGATLLGCGLAIVRRRWEVIDHG